MQLLLASHNPGKLRELQVILSVLPKPITLLGSADLLTTQTLDPEETGRTFAENASLKARAFARASSLPALADDSGLCLPALDNFPGVHTARWLPGSDADRVAGLLKLLEEKQVSDRRAYYSTVLCYFNPQADQEEFFAGECWGSLALAPHGNSGFGYDPIFIPDLEQLPEDQAAALQGQTFGQLPMTIKNKISHRAIALNKFISFLAHINQ